jgi:insertion element IS1 protein InsB
MSIYPYAPGTRPTGKQNHRCKVCGRAFVLTPENRVITEEQRVLIERLLLERISLRGIR